KLVKDGATICSMGMSNDYELAIKCGSNLVRIGSKIFKER
ncbi:MAG: YggS family pyridoxal phosphate enzyme, partial [Sulfurovaceae bacterium]|nr:YggS family pyridoxal phosphate enzyme [Sulfurovaceae bacterium]